MKAIIIARVSTEEQKDAGNSLPAQITRLESYCDRKSFEIIKRFSFDESAYKDKRADFDEILDYVLGQKQTIAVCFDKVDRLSRNVFDKRVAELYEKALKDEVELHFPSDGQVINSNISAVEKFQFGISLGLAKYFSDAISDNVKRAQEQMIRIGIWPGKAPYGYRNTGKDDDKKWIVAELFEAKVVEKMYEWYSTGAFSMDLVRKEVKKVFNVSFSKGKVDHILGNPFYCGTMRYNEQEYPHNYDRIISPELFAKVQNTKLGHHKKHFKYAGLPFLYRGLIRCAECGCLITPERKKKKNGNTYHYYHCTQYNGKHNAEWLTEDELTRQFSDAFKGLQIPEEILEDITETLKQTHNSKAEFRQSLYEQYQKDYEKYQNRIESMYEDKLDGSITESFYEKKRKEYRVLQDEIQEKMKKLQYADEEYYLTSEYILKLASKASELFESSEPEEKRILLKMTLQNLQLDGRKARFEWIKPFDVIASHASRSAWLPNSAVMLYQLFPHDLMEQMRIKLEMLKELLGSESQYETVEVKNGQFCRYTI